MTIKLENLTKIYNADGDYPLHAVQSVDLEIKQGEFVAIMGPSGSGKTTFLKLCYGALVPTAGRIQLFSEDLRMMSRDSIAMSRRRIGVVHQDCQFVDHLNVYDNISLPLNVVRRGVALSKNLATLGITCKH